MRAGERPRGVGIKALRSTLKKIKLVKTAAGKVMKTARRQRENQTVSLVSEARRLIKGHGRVHRWNREGLHSRVDVTKSFCNYIKEHDLQNPNDRRVIQADDKLATLLGWDKNSDVDLTYYECKLR